MIKFVEISDTENIKFDTYEGGEVFNSGDAAILIFNANNA